MALIPSLKKEEVNESAKNIYNNFEETAGSVPEWVQVMAHSPQILEGFTHLFKSVMKEGKVESLLKWKIGYTVSEMLKCPFCVDVTEKMLKKLGIDKEGLENIKNKDNISDKEEELLKMVEDITDNGNIDNRDLFDSFISKFDYEEAVEIVSVIGLFNYINRFNNTFGVLPE
jgi:alkylhydroperoxidase family enzyme